MAPVVSSDGTVSYSVVVLNNSGNFSDFPQLEPDGNVLEFSLKAVNLGLIIDYEFYWIDHAELIYRKVFAALRNL